MKKICSIILLISSSIQAWYYQTVTNATPYDLEVKWVYDGCRPDTHMVKSGDHRKNNGYWCDLNRIDFHTKDKKKSGSFNHKDYRFNYRGNSLWITIIEQEGKLIVDKKKIVTGKNSL